MLGSSLLSAGLAAVLLTAAPLQADDDKRPEKPQTERQLRQWALGQFLFRSPLLSHNGKISCATCHDPHLSFTDGRATSHGILETGVGRNAPTLLELRHVEHYPGARRKAKNPLDKVGALSLEERCLGPIENPLEMGSSIEDVLGRLRGMPQVREQFKGAFGVGKPVTDKRLGEALGAYVRSLKAPETPYHRHLAGKQDQLTPTQQLGLDIFNGKGTCAKCHSGPALSDGLMHVAALPQSKRMKKQQRELASLRQDVVERVQRVGLDLPSRGLAKLQFTRLVSQSMCGEPQSGYGGFPQASVTETHTLSLWDVARTGPYFRDGSIDHLESAVRQHVAEMQAVRNGRDEIRNRLRGKRAGASRPPKVLRPGWAKNRFLDPPAPEELTNGDYKAIVAFLDALSPSNG